MEVNVFELISAIVTVCVLVAGYAIRPHHARCPDTYDLRTGIQPSGRFDCWPHPSAPADWDPRNGRIEDWDGTHGKPERSVQSEATLGGQIYCTGGSRPIVVDYRTVGCRR